MTVKQAQKMARGTHAHTQTHNKNQQGIRARTHAHTKRTKRFAQKQAPGKKHTDMEKKRERRTFQAKPTKETIVRQCRGKHSKSVLCQIQVWKRREGGKERR